MFCHKPITTPPLVTFPTPQNQYIFHDSIHLYDHNRYCPDYILLQAQIGSYFDAPRTYRRNLAVCRAFHHYYAISLISQSQCAKSNQLVRIQLQFALLPILLSQTDEPILSLLEFRFFYCPLPSLSHNSQKKISIPRFSLTNFFQSPSFTLGLTRY